jgi:hypothetical protein
MTVHVCSPRAHTAWKDTWASMPDAVCANVIHVAQPPCMTLLPPQLGVNTHRCFVPITFGKFENTCGADARAAATNSRFDGLMPPSSFVCFEIPPASAFTAASAQTRTIATAPTDLLPTCNLPSVLLRQLSPAAEKDLGHALRLFEGCEVPRLWERQRARVRNESRVGLPFGRE